MKKKIEEEFDQPRNFVHKHMVQFNKPKVFVDQKKEQKKGKRIKHKKRWE